MSSGRGVVAARHGDLDFRLKRQHLAADFVFPQAELQKLVGKLPALCFPELQRGVSVNPVELAGATSNLSASRLKRKCDDPAGFEHTCPLVHFSFHRITPHSPHGKLYRQDG